MNVYFKYNAKADVSERFFPLGLDIILIQRENSFFLTGVLQADSGKFICSMLNLICYISNT